MRTVILDTNVLLSNPGVLLEFPDANVIVPETVLGEIDKLKISRVDPDLRFKGREVSRMLFELSESGNLAEGIALPDGGTLRVAPLESDSALPDSMSTRNADDRILAAAYIAAANSDDEVTLITNDLNMLLKAQTYGISVERRAEGDGGLGKRAARWIQRYRTPVTILAIAVAVFAGVLALSFYTSKLAGSGKNTAGVPSEFRDLLSSDYRNLLDGLITLEQNPSDADAMKQVANSYYALRDQTGNVAFAQKGIEYYSRYLQRYPNDASVRTDMAALYFYSGMTDRAIQETSTVLKADATQLQANFNLGIFYWRGRTDYQAAARQFETVIDLTKTSSDAHSSMIQSEARTNLKQIVTDAQKAGVKITVNQSYLSGGTI